MKSDTIQLAHGSGGQYTHDLIRSLFGRYFGNPILEEFGDSAVPGRMDGQLVFTTDSHVVKPLFYPGGDIGKLAVTGTVNDLAVAGARPLWLSCAMVIEEGFAMADLERIVKSMSRAAQEAGVQIVTGDTKVVGRGEADGLFINTSGIGVLASEQPLGIDQIRVGDKVLVSGFIGDHEAAIICARGSFPVEMKIQSDCAALNYLTTRLLNEVEGIRIMRDPTRGGLATTLNEFADGREFGIRIAGERIPVRQEVLGLCEPLGFDPWYFANEGKVVVIAARGSAAAALELLQSHPLGRAAAEIGEVIGKPPGKVLLRTAIGTDRVLDMLSGTMLPRIC